MKKPFNPWSPEDVQRLRDLYPTTHIDELTALFGRSRQALFTKAGNLGIIKTVTSRSCGIAERIIGILSACDSPRGKRFCELMAGSGLTRRKLADNLNRLRTAGTIFVVGSVSQYRYFATAERRDACREAAEKDIDMARVERMLKANRERWTDERRAEAAAKRAARPKAPKPPKPVKVKPPKPPKPPKPKAKPKHKQRPMTVVRVKPAKPKTPEETSRQRFAAMKAVVPPHVKVQRIPSGVDYRYTVDPASVPRLDARLWAGRDL